MTPYGRQGRRFVKPNWRGNDFAADKSKTGRLWRHPAVDEIAADAANCCAVDRHGVAQIGWSRVA
jgi:hypothetical protein